MLRLSLTVILILSTVSGCISPTNPSAAFTAQVENEIPDRAAIQNANAQAAQSRVEFQQNQQNSGARYSPQTYDPSGYVQSQFIPASGRPKDIQSGTDPVTDAISEVAPADEEEVEKLNYSSLPDVRIVGVIAVPGGAKAMIQRGEEDSVIRHVGEEIVHDGQTYSIKKITKSGEVIVESEKSQLFSIH